MKNVKFYNVKAKITALVLTATIAGTMIGCSKTTKENNTVPESTPAIVQVVDETNNKIESIMPEMNDEITNNTSIILLLDLIASKDANGKVSAEDMSKLKSRIDADNMVRDFNNFQDNLQKKMLEEKKVIRISEVLPEELAQDKTILSQIEDILENIFNATNKEEALTHFDKLYSLFALGKELEIDGVNYKISDLTLVSRAIANTYAETGTVQSRNYITEDQAKVMDKVLNDQNNKAEIRTRLEVLYNLMDSKSAIDVEATFNAKYEEITKKLEGKVNLTPEVIKDLVNYANMKYLESDKVTIEDKNKVVKDYSDEKVNDVLLGIEAILKYSIDHSDDAIRLSNLYIDAYKETDSGKTDTVATDFAESNSIYLSNTKDLALDENGNINYNKLRNNPYFANTITYLTKDNFTHSQKQDDEIIETNIIWNEISNGANLVNNMIVLATLRSLPEYSNQENNIEIAESNLIEAIKANEKSVLGECIIKDYTVFVKTK